MDLPVKTLDPTAHLPQFAHATDAGMDLCSIVSLIIQPGERALVSTGLAMAIPPQHVGLLWDKSGIATKAGITTIAGVIDSGYRGEIKVALLNVGTEPYAIRPGQKVAQLLIQPVVQPTLVAVEDLPVADRGANGFGSTGL